MKTHAIPFFQCNPQGDELFAVRPDVPSEDSLNWASTLLDTAIGLLRDGDSHESFGAMVLVKMAKAAIDAVEVDNG